MEKINLNFFGEQVSIDSPKDLTMLRKNISEKYSLSSSDAAEIMLFYIKDSKKIYITNENDFNNFKNFKISTIFLDVNKNSKLYLDNISQLKDEKKDKKQEIKEESNKESKGNEKQEIIDIEKTKKEIEELKAKSEEILQKQREKRTLYEDKRREIILQKQELEKMDEELSLECAVDMEEFSDKRNEINKKIEELKKRYYLKKRK